MDVSQLTNLSSKKYRLYIYPFLGAILYLLFMLINSEESFFASYALYKPIDFVVEIGLILVFTCITVESGIIVTKLLNNYIPWEITPRKRFTVQLLVQVSLLVLLFSAIFELVSWLEVPSSDPLQDALVLRQAWVLGAMFSLLNTAVFTAEYFFTQLNNSKVEAMQLKQNVIQAQLDALKSQIDPHFLFNNFSTLSALIEEDQELSAKFVQRLSQVYRYFLSNRTQDIICLEDELAFISAYYFLYQIRYGNAIQLQINVPITMYKRGIAPVTLQLLLENAIKHNTLSESEPLIVKIDVENDYLIVVNNLNKSTVIEPSSKMGLKNIETRYKLLANVKPVILSNDKTFTVKIPLLSYGN